MSLRSTSENAQHRVRISDVNDEQHLKLFLSFSHRSA
jgi:hypothetical protein